MSSVDLYEKSTDGQSLAMKLSLQPLETAQVQIIEIPPKLMSYIQGYLGHC